MYNKSVNSVILVTTIFVFLISCSYVPPRPRPQLDGISISYKTDIIDSGKMETVLIHFNFVRLECNVFEALITGENPEKPQNTWSLQKKLDPWLNEIEDAAKGCLMISDFAPLWLAPARMNSGETSPLKDEGTVDYNKSKAKKLSWQPASTSVTLLYDLESGFLIRGELSQAEQSIRVELLKTNHATLAAMLSDVD